MMTRVYASFVVCISVFNVMNIPLSLSLSLSLRYILSGVLGSLFLFASGWEYVFLLVGLSGLVWAFLVQRLVKNNLSQVNYKLLENGDLKEHRSSTHPRKQQVDPNYVEVPWKLLMKQTPIM